MANCYVWRGQAFQSLIGILINCNRWYLKALYYLVFKVRLRECKNHNTTVCNLARCKSLKASLDKVRGWFTDTRIVKCLHIRQYRHFCSYALANTYPSAHLVKTSLINGAVDKICSYRGEMQKFSISDGIVRS